MIKAIETEYKGYRFRSRLEARWAVFFDTLGIAWEYEKEGYDLGKAGWYLPDFWLPEAKTWLEVKPDIKDIQTSSLKVFCAGKVGGVTSDWRHSLLSAYARNFFFDTQEEYLNNPSNKELEMIAGCRYVGPFSYDGCGGHGSGNPQIFGNHGSSQYPGRVVADCQQRIKSCDVVFAWINSEDCFGTLVELGYAAALNKEIWIASPPAHTESQLPVDDDEYYYEDRPGDNLWYAFAMADKVRFAARPIDAFLSLHEERLSPEQRKCLELAKNSRKPVLMVQGNPWPHEYKLLHFDTKGATGFLLETAWTHALRAKKPDALKLAYTAARSARFEHGEHGTR